MIQTGYFRTHPKKLKRYFVYHGWLNSKYAKFDSLMDQHDNTKVPQPVKDGDLIFIRPYNIDWWLKCWGCFIDKKIHDYELLTTPQPLSRFHQILSIQTEHGKNQFNLYVLNVLSTGIIESDDLPILKEPLIDPPPLPLDDSKEIYLPNPRKRPYIYIPQNSAEEFLTHEKWNDMRSNGEYMVIDGFDDSMILRNSILGEFKIRKDYRGDAKNWTPTKREAVAQASVGLGSAVGLLDIQSGSVVKNNVRVLILREKWDKKAVGGTLTKDEMSEIIVKCGMGLSPETIGLFDYTNIIYQRDDEDGYHLNLPTDDTGPAYKNVDKYLYRSLSTYDESKFQPEHSDVDQYAVDQFVAAHVAMESESDSDRNVVSVERFMTAFDEYAQLNDLKLDDLDFDVYRDMRKGELRNILEESFGIERKSVRIKGEPTRVFHPVELDQSITKLLAIVDTANDDSE